MWIKRDCEVKQMQGDEGAKIKQYFHPENTSNQIHYSLAQVTLEQGKKTKLHKLTSSSETYYILEGDAVLKINGEAHNLGKDDSMVVLPNSKQRIENIGTDVLKFLCIVEPAWKQSNDILLE